MKKLTLLLTITATLAAVSCSQPKDTASDPAQAGTDMQPGWAGDSTVYGLACDGCTDTLLVILTNTAHDPDTFDILNASRRHQVFGRPHIGDLLAVVRNADAPTVADVAIDLERLKGKWCYTVKPELRQRLGMPEGAQRPQLPDSLLDELLQPREYGFEIMNDYTARPVGQAYRAATTDEASPVVYPRLKHYRDWHIFNGQLVLTETALDSLGNLRPVGSDTATLVTLRQDTLVLRFNDGLHGYYRKP